MKVSITLFLHHLYREGSQIHKNVATRIIKLKDELKQLPTLGDNDRERVYSIKYCAVFKTSGLSQMKARKEFGLENMYKRSIRVEGCITEVQEICSALSEP